MAPDAPSTLEVGRESVPEPLLAALDLARIREREFASGAARLARTGPLHPSAERLAVEARDLALTHAERLGRRLSELGGSPSEQPAEPAPPSDPFPAESSSVLQSLYSGMHRLVIGYATLQAIATRARDSWIIATEGTAAHLAREHTQSYLAACGRLGQVLHDVVLWELEILGYPCRCTCPGCGAGICLCAVGGRIILGEAWASARPVPFDEGIRVQRPRPSSPAGRAGFLQDDLITSVDGKPVDTAAVLISAIKHYEPGNSIGITVSRMGAQLELRLVPDAAPPAVPNLSGPEDDCIRPSGPVFHRGRARDLQRQFRRLSEDGGTARISRLSQREIEVVRLIANGATNPMIAERLHISRPTVARHVANVLNKLDLANRTEVASAAAALGLLADS